jgi:hypothetical protein
MIDADQKRARVPVDCSYTPFHGPHRSSSLAPPTAWHSPFRASALLAFDALSSGAAGIRLLRRLRRWSPSAYHQQSGDESQKQ